MPAPTIGPGTGLTLNGMGASTEKPASPCLASRIPYGTEITRENLAMVEDGEELLRSLGFRDLRLRRRTREP